MDQYRVFEEVYHRALEWAVKNRPDDYPWHYPGPHHLSCATVSNRMMAALRRGVNHVTINGTAWRRTCEELGIKCNRKAIAKFLGQSGQSAT